MKVFKKNAAFFALAAAFLLTALSAVAQTGDPKQEKLLNGMKVLMWSDPKADSVSVRVRIHSGAAFDPQGKEGVMQMLADSLFPNQASRDFFSEDLGGSLEVTTTYDFIEVSASAKPANFLTMLETVSTAISNPQIDKDLTAAIKASLLKRLEDLGKEPSYVADTAVGNRLFGTFPYGRPTAGTKESVSRIDFADLIDARQRFLTADNATVAVIGNFDRTLGFRAIRRYFGSWLKADRRIPSTFKQPDDPPAQPLNIASPRSGTTLVRLALRGVARSDKEVGASLIFASIMRDRLASRLKSADLIVMNQPHILPGSITIGFSGGENSVAQENAGQVDFVRKAIGETVTEAEFSAAKQSVQSEWVKKDVASFWLDADTYKINSVSADLRAIESVTLGDVRSYAERAKQKPIASVIVASPRST